MANDFSDSTALLVSNITESTTFNDAVLSNGLFTTNVSEGIQINLNQVKTSNAFAALPFGASGFADVVTIGFQAPDATATNLYVATITENSVLNDSTSVIGIFSANKIEATTVNDAQVSTGNFVYNITEAVTLTDVTIGNSLLASTVTENISINLTPVLSANTFAALPFGASGFADINLTNYQISDLSLIHI